MSEDMSGWRECKLGNTGNVITGKTPSKDNPEDWGNEVLFITPSDYKNYGKKAYSSIRMLSRVGIERQKNRLLPPSSVLVTCIGSDMGKSVVNSSSCVTNQQINAIIPDLSVVNADYLYYLTIDLYDIFRSKGGDGTAVPILNKSDFEKIDILLPSLPEQKAIAAILSSLDDKIDLLHRQNKTLESIAETLFRQWFIEEVQDNWEEYSVSDFADHVKENVVPAKSKSEYYHHYSLPAFDEGKRPTLELGSEILSNKYKVVEHSILVSKLNPKVPRIWPVSSLPSKNSICSTEFQVLKPKNIKLYGYLLFLLRSNDAVDALSMAASGTSGSHQRVRPEDIFNIKTSLPSLARAEQYSNMVMPGIAKTSSNQIQIQSLEKLRDTLLPKLMSGEVRVIN